MNYAWLIAKMEPRLAGVPMGMRPSDGDEERMRNGDGAAKFGPFFRGVRMSLRLTDGDENRFYGPRGINALDPIFRGAISAGVSCPRPFLTIFCFACLALASPQQPAQQKSRDLKYEEDRPTQAPVTIPRGYALIIGIAKYKNLPAKAQLDFAERDAESVYSVLINPEGGNFRAENVHRLIGAKATLANLKQELEVWLPSVAKESDRVVIYFAGHGFISNGRAYLAPYDLDRKS